jgi:hypothetical protein
MVMLLPPGMDPGTSETYETASATLSEERAMFSRTFVTAGLTIGLDMTGTKSARVIGTDKRSAEHALKTKTNAAIQAGYEPRDL